jgi:DDE superfamily endonuclease
MATILDADDDILDVMIHLAANNLELEEELIRPIEDEGIEWGRRCLLEDVSDSDAISNFRFRKEHLQAIALRLWPKMQPFLEGEYDSIQCRNRYAVPFETGFLVLLYRIAAHRRLCPDMEKFFGIRKSKLSAILLTFVCALYAVANPYLTTVGLFQHRFAYYAQLIEDKSHGLVRNIWGFIDGPLRPIQRPTHHQRQAYSGHKRWHGIKFQSVVARDGLFIHLFGPIMGNRHDSFMLGESNLLQDLDAIMPIDGVTYALYGDPAYLQSCLHPAPGRLPGTLSCPVSGRL